MKVGIFAICVVVLATVEAHPSQEHRRQREARERRGRIQYDSFDDYLMDVVAPVQSFEEAPQAEQSRESRPAESSVPTTQDILGYFRDVPREHWSCCMLGKLSGDKGFHCHAGFYAARIQNRNYNRAHNRRMPMMHGSDRVENWGMDIMRTFHRCVVQHSSEFHRCCYAATVERREIRRWQRFRGPAEQDEE